MTTIIRGGTVVNADRAFKADVLVYGDKIVAVGDKLDERGKIKLTNLNTLWSFSSILHGEQGALSLSASLCHILRDPGAQEYAANQAREEARHVAGFTRYIGRRWGAPLPVGRAT